MAPWGFMRESNHCCVYYVCQGGNKHATDTSNITEETKDLGCGLCSLCAGGETKSLFCKSLHSVTQTKS